MLHRKHGIVQVSTPCPRKKGTGNILEITSTNSNKRTQSWQVDPKCKTNNIADVHLT